MENQNVMLIVDGEGLCVPPGLSLIEAVWNSGRCKVEGVGCLGQGVCGACTALVRSPDSPTVEAVLACETLAQDGMQVTFLSRLDLPRKHPYQVSEFQDSWQALGQLSRSFPEAEHCRHCGGCDVACPRGLAVQEGVELAVEGRLREAAANFDHCVMCELCTHACPESINPNHLGLAVRRISASLMSRPGNLLARLRELERGEHTIDRGAL